MPDVKVLLISEAVDGFCLQRLDAGGASAGDTLHDTLVDPLEYLRARTET
jgi:hypothetical protein